MHNFRSVEFWKSSIMTLPDYAFFELLRTVFGKIKTPYNKQLLMSNLEKFLLRDDIVNNINNYISRNDSIIIAAVAALNEPTPADLEVFFAGEFSRASLHDLIVNLEERFILYRFSDEKQSRRFNCLALNPVLEPVLSPIAADRTLLFPSVAANEANVDEMTANDAQGRATGYIDDRILAALLSFVSRNKLFFRSGGNMRQKTANAAKTLFPGLAVETIIGGLRFLGLFFSEGETLVPDYRRFTVFGNLTRRERMAYCAAGILSYIDSQENAALETFSPWLLRSKVRNYAEIIGGLYDMLDVGRLYAGTTLRKLTYIVESGSGEKKCDNIIDAMEKTGMIARAGETAWRKVPLTEDGAADSAIIVMDTPNTLLVYPEIAYNDVIAIAAFTDVIEAGMTVRFELNRDSAVQAFNHGFSAAAIIELLQRLSQNRIDDNMLFTLRDWEKRHGEVVLRRGLVLTLSPQQRHIAETKPLAKLIVETLAPGIYLLPESAEESAVQALSRAGVSIIARRGECRGEDDSGDGGDALRHFYQSLLATRPPADEISPVSRPDDSLASILIDNFHSILKGMRLGGEARDELAARVDRRLVLCESQLKDANVRYEKLEARGLDYVGKAVIAKQAIAIQAPVEIVLPGRQKQDHIFGIPKALEKTGSESVLVLELLEGEGADAGAGAGDTGTLRVPLGKISLLRRIKKSIFEG